MSDKSHITELESEISKLKAELERAKGRERDLEESRRAMLYMLEDLNEATANIRAAKIEWEMTFDTISDPIFVHDKEFRIIRANRAYQKMTGMKFKEFIGSPYYEVFPKMEAPSDLCLKTIEEMEGQTEELYLSSMDKIFKVKIYPIIGIDGKYIYSVHIMEDITEIKKADERIKQEMAINTHLLMIADAVADTMDIDRLMDRVCQCVSKIFGSDMCLSYLYDEGDRVFKPHRFYGLSPDKIPIFMTEPLNEKDGLVKDTVNIMEKDKEAGIFGWIGEARTIFVIPLIGRYGYQGLLMGIHINRSEFDERERKVMKGISQHVSLALEDARLYKESIDKSMELSHKIETIQVMHEIDKNILSTLKPSGVLEIAIRMVSRVIPCDRAAIALLDKERGGFIYAAGFGLTSLQKDAFVPYKDTNTSEIIKTGRPQYIASLTDLKNLPFLERELLKEGFLSHLGVPIFVKNEIAGVLNIGAKRHSAFIPENLSTLEKLSYQIGIALENARLVTDLEELFLGTVKSLSSGIDAKSPWTAGHSERVTKYALSIARGMEWGEKHLRDIELAGLLHDIGKLGTYETILDKSGKLTDEEFKLIRQHPLKGAEILMPIKQLKHIIPAVRHHHEFYNGKGYPDGLKGEDIPFMARIICVADSVDAMGADRPYRKGRPMDEIISELKRCSGTQFDPRVVEVFLEVI